MDRLKRKRFVRKAGLQVPKHIERLMAMRHPTVSILCERRTMKFCLVQHVRGRDFLICRIADRPTLANTVYFLDRCHPSRFKGKWAQERALRAMDENPEIARVAERSRLMVADGSKDLWNALNNRLVLPVPR